MSKRKMIFLVVNLVLCALFFNVTMSYASNYRMYYSIDNIDIISTSHVVISGTIIRGEPIIMDPVLPGQSVYIYIYETDTYERKSQFVMGGIPKDYKFKIEFTDLNPDTEYTCFLSGATKIDPEKSDVTFKTPSESTMLGDVNGDNIVNSTDYTLVKRYILGVIDSFPSPKGLQSADMDGNGNINSTDLVILRRFILQL